MSEQSRTELSEGRESGLSRVEAFSDGVFAIAITLLVLQIEVPDGVDSGSALWNAVKDQSGDLFAFAISFAVIGRIWLTHHRFLGSLRSLDHGFMALNLLLLAFVVLIPFFSQVLGEYGDLGLASALYAANLVLLSATQVVIYRRAVSSELAHPEHAAEISSAVGSWAYNVIVFAISIPLSIVLGSYTPLVWLLLIFDPADRRRRKG